MVRDSLFSGNLAADLTSDVTMMNPTLSMNEWHALRNLNSGIYGMNPSRTGPELPKKTMAAPRIITLTPGQVIFRWCDSGDLEPAAASWWSTKRGAQAILRNANGQDTSPHARAYSNVSTEWASNLRAVVFARVRAPVKCFLGIGREIFDPLANKTWASNELQLYVPGMASGNQVLSDEAREHFWFARAIPSTQISPNQWEAVTCMRF